MPAIERGLLLLAHPCHRRLAAAASGDVVCQLAAGKRFLFSHLGETELRSFEDPVRLYEVRWHEQG